MAKYIRIAKVFSDVYWILLITTYVTLLSQIIVRKTLTNIWYFTWSYLIR